MSEETVPDETMAKARAIHEEASNFNSMTWHGPYRDEIAEVVMYVWDEAYLAGQNDCGSDYCRA